TTTHLDHRQEPQRDRKEERQTADLLILADEQRPDPQRHVFHHMKVPLQTPPAVVDQHTLLQGVPCTRQRRHLHTPPLAILRCCQRTFITTHGGHLIADSHI